MLKSLEQLTEQADLLDPVAVSVTVAILEEAVSEIQGDREVMAKTKLYSGNAKVLLHTHATVITNLAHILTTRFSGYTVYCKLLYYLHTLLAKLLHMDDYNSELHIISPIAHGCTIVYVEILAVDKVLRIW